MATRTTLNVSMPPELGRFVERLVASGRYASASEVIRAALRALQEQIEPAPKDATRARSRD